MAIEREASFLRQGQTLADLYLADEDRLLAELIVQAGLGEGQRQFIDTDAIDLATQARAGTRRGQIIDQFLQEYGLSTGEGVTLMRLCEALIRTPDALTAYALIRDKIGSGDWAEHAAHSTSPLVNVSTRGLQLSSAWISTTGGVKAKNLAAKLGDAVLRRAVEQAMALMGEHFVLGGSIETAMRKSRQGEKNGSAYSYDMLGEAAHTEHDAQRYFDAYLHAINALASQSHQYVSMSEAPGISVKLSALHPRYEYAQRDRCIPQLVARLRQLAMVAKSAGVGLTIDAEEADRLELSLQIVAHLLQDAALGHWDGLGVVVQAYQRRAREVIAMLVEMANNASRSITVRLVKGAYWDMEIKRAQELGLSSYPVFTRKENTDISYLACARQLLDAGEIIFPQFATHNAHTAAAVMNMAGNRKTYEFQRLHGMGQSLHEALVTKAGVRSRIYAPVGRHKDLLPYLVRRLLENGANSSFVNQLLDPAYPITDIVRDPLGIASENKMAANPAIPTPADLFSGTRRAAAGIDLTQSTIAAAIEPIAQNVEHFDTTSFQAGATGNGEPVSVINPATNSEIGSVYYASREDLLNALAIAKTSVWAGQTIASERAACLNRAADLLEAEQNTFLRLCVAEAGKSYPDVISELREAVDFCRYYANQCCAPAMEQRKALGVVACISPWNFPLAIFIGQVVAALAAGNSVIAKPAEQTPLIAIETVRLLHRAGIPENALHLIIGDGPDLGAQLVASPVVNAVCFTGSTRTAKHIAASLADTGRALTPLIAETGGINAMLIDSTALLEQAVSDVVASAFQSAGQRCSACRVVCVQDDVADDFIRMLAGSMALLSVGDPAYLRTDVGPVVDAAAQSVLRRYIKDKRKVFGVLAQTPILDDAPDGFFVAPIAFEIPEISCLSEEVFGPVLHVYRYQAADLERVINDINTLGYGLTMGLHTRIDDRVDYVAARAEVGNLYVNRNQIGAVVGVQPFGGHGLSGTGPKAGGPHYLKRLSRSVEHTTHTYGSVSAIAEQNLEPDTAIDDNVLQAAKRHFHKARPLDREVIFTSVPFYIRQMATPGALIFGKAVTLPGPTGETNTLTLSGRGVLLCLGGDSPDDLEKQILASLAAGNSVIASVNAQGAERLNAMLSPLHAAGLAEGMVTLVAQETTGTWLNAAIDGVVCDNDQRESVAAHLNRREGPIVPVLSWRDDPERFCVERTLTVNTTAAGGNASLLAM